jgi:hypothetical protein
MRKEIKNEPSLMNNLVEKREIFEKRKTVSQMAAEAELEEEIA